jgi:hypothetical protein
MVNQVVLIISTFMPIHYLLLQVSINKAARTQTCESSVDNRAVEEPAVACSWD